MGGFDNSPGLGGGLGASFSRFRVGLGRAGTVNLALVVLPQPLGAEADWIDEVGIGRGPRAAGIEMTDRLLDDFQAVFRQRRVIAADQPLVNFVARRVSRSLPPSPVPAISSASASTPMHTACSSASCTMK